MIHLFASMILEKVAEAIPVSKTPIVVAEGELKPCADIRPSTNRARRKAGLAQGEVKKKSRGQEARLRALMQRLYPKFTWSSYRPDFLMNPETKRPLELDLYSPHLRTAVELMGPSHFKAMENYGGEAAYRKIVERDKLKALLCARQTPPVRILYVRWDREEQWERDILKQLL